MNAEITIILKCSCGANLRVLPQEPSGYRVQHGDNPEMVSPVFTGEERSFGWRDSVHRYAYDDDRDDYAREQAIEDGRMEYER